MRNIDVKEILEIAKKHFNTGNYQSAEVLLGQVLLANGRFPDAYYMLGTIYYDKGKFSKAIEFYKKALEIDPGFTDASVGLSILYNDLGKYDEGREVFVKAQQMLSQKTSAKDPFIEDRLSQKHEELGSLYEQYHRYKEAMEHFLKAVELSTSRKAEIAMKIVDCLLSTGHSRKAIKELKFITREYPHYLPARIQLGKVFYNLSRLSEAIEQWEGVLLRDPTNQEAQRFLRIAQHAGAEATL